jgi:hypothetical protein
MSTLADVWESIPCRFKGPGDLLKTVEEAVEHVDSSQGCGNVDQDSAVMVIEGIAYRAGGGFSDYAELFLYGSSWI